MYSRLAAVFAAGALAITGLATGTAHANPVPNPTLTLTPAPAPAPTVSHAVKCGTVTITVNNPTRYANLRLQYQSDRGPVRTVLVAANGNTVQPVDVREDSGRHWVRWRLWGGPERGWDQPTWTVGQLTDWHPSGFNGRWAATVRVDSDCRPNYERAETPTAVQPECDATLGKLVIPSDRGVTYRVSRDGGPYRVARAGEYNVRPGVYRVRAYVMPGHRLVGERSWRLVIEAAEACPTPTPTPTPTVTVTPTVDPTPDPEPTPTVTETETEEPTPAPTVTDRRTVVVRDYLPVRIDTGLGGLAK